MSLSPPIRRLSSTNSSSREDLINQYEAEEERIINILSRKLEQASPSASSLREEKIDLENALEAESESHVNRLSREISALRLAQQQTQANGSGGGSPVDTRAGLHAFLSNKSPLEPSAELMLDAMRRENEQLRSRLVDTERDYIRISRLNEIYREELIEHRRRLGLSVDNLIGLSSVDPYSQPTHRRSSFTASSPSTSVVTFPTSTSTQLPRPIPGVPIPRPPSQIHRPVNTISESTTPLSHSPSSSLSSPSIFSPVTASPALPTSLASITTNLTTPPSSASFTSNPGTPFARPLSYPSVPPPSLSSSFGSPTIMRSPSSRRNSLHRHGSVERRVAESGSLRSASRGSAPSQSHSRRASVERGARVAETGQLVPRARTDSLLEPVEDMELPANTDFVSTAEGSDGALASGSSGDVVALL
ncbi:hypothetical protein OBBRIDRAFT_775434 [Obba rivulosa]|uniref:Uncharacterized protein n=1 Tax=Obba rivulosa TaxID=1052685 RepID=A0A8E2B300_9APHY|nr:hypothetical protein OBBRIDRAFT_775434 [Obba rivulosa]